MASIEFAYEEARECCSLLLLLPLLLLIDLSSEGDIGKGEKPSSESSSMESLLLLPLPLRAANFNAFSNIGDSGVMLELVGRLGVMVVLSTPPPPPLSRWDIFDRDFALGLGVWGV